MFLAYVLMSNDRNSIWISLLPPLLPLFKFSSLDVCIQGFYFIALNLLANKISI